MITAKVLFAKGMVTIDARENQKNKPRQGTKNHKSSTRAPREWKGWERKQRWAVGKVHRRSACWGMGPHMLAWCREAEKPPNMQRWECNLAAHTMNILLFPSKLRRRITSHTVLAVPSWHTWFYCVHQIVRIARMEAPLLNSSKGSVRSSKFSTITIASMCRSNKLSKQQTKRTNNKEDVIDSSHNSQKYKRTWASTKAPEIRTTARVSSPQSSHHLRKKTWIEAMRSSHDYSKTHNSKPLWLFEHVWTILNSVRCRQPAQLAGFARWSAHFCKRLSCRTLVCAA